MVVDAAGDCHPAPLTPFTTGLHTLDPDVHAWLQPDGGWGLSNAGLIAGDDAALLVDTFFDAATTRLLLADVDRVRGERPLRVAVNTHGNGDHCYGNFLLPAGTLVLARPEAVVHMEHESPGLVAGLLATPLPEPLQDYLHRAFGRFDFASVLPRLPDRTVTTTETVDLGGRSVDLVPLGPGHTAGDLVVRDPASEVVFAGDLLFIGSTPIMWEGPATSWIAALDDLAGLGSVFVPGHGPVVGPEGVRAVRGYLELIAEQAADLYRRGVPPLEAAARLSLGPYTSWGHPERAVVTLDAEYCALDPGRERAGLVELFGAMAALAAAP